MPVVERYEHAGFGALRLVKYGREWRIERRRGGDFYTFSKLGQVREAKARREFRNTLAVIGPPGSAHATIIDANRNPSDMARFPIEDKAHARNALARLPQAHGLPATAQKAIAQRAANVLGEVTPGARKYGVKRITRARAPALAQRPIIIGPSGRVKP